MAKSVRTTVSVPAELYADLAKAAESSHVSTAWVIREALRLYLGERASPLARSAGTNRKSTKQAGSK
ncbi:MULTISPECIES: ribbon-helix-helix domain-containing protein [pseudomallei group]|uniref:ribbon-helix-helix domain-containing protein n=1 Tax=pseudomallei group TaxID=111527 RepID=UPI000E69A382|nr:MULTISPECIES: ribbon-helix-helix domain-containing protein [pseudomallei group]MCS6497139.1 ribbon-helix-helix domain-containing protein [Burkholderia thailandensis]NVH98165.1 CopG family transcriptional regulator [Burkholderia pseudomallei]RIV63257.1 CopG family transcriptional regulator [Burkholderia pseudomallei]RIV73073.1 CopG family transcriptional regulator [Burkholderia pseudomallei]